MFQDIGSSLVLILGIGVAAALALDVTFSAFGDDQLPVRSLSRRCSRKRSSVEM